ncbi:saccharopine dehydrogenase family protein [Sinomicrobium soli]|uniref:saccharopine dehydrogenase family protein n=1 Tax=Sinomicrobium sp. N-1-3-6 TaxID=2219864 RepID=UPI000DCB7F02|nr:saccharopine dehydrogenase family protein [Sinomicrobium sp. N-1-3-6]RAV28172.1 saccharopine dehydrogenase [Sinomicrobium sp. N-1-3-6]
MKHILIIGTGKSTSYLIDYLYREAGEGGIGITLGDRDKTQLELLKAQYPGIGTVRLDISRGDLLEKNIRPADLVISMLPAALHIEIAKTCLVLGKHLVTASYVSPAMQQLDREVRDKGLVFMNEIGLDPGIDHMSAMQVIDRIREQGGRMLLFESFCGGLVAPESDTNLWNYKFTWNPRNVVLAGQGGAAKFIQEGAYKYIPYHKLFRRTEFLDVEGYGKFEAYANRDSLKYREAYGLQDVLTLYRGTMRKVGFSRAWNIFVQLGMTDDSYVMEGSENMSFRDFINAFLPFSPTDSVELKLRYYLKIDQDDIMWAKLEELGLFDHRRKVGLKNASPARILQKILEESWSLEEHDRDMIVMYHKFGYELAGERYQTDASMVVTGQDRTYTAMAKTVGLPVGMAALYILRGKISAPGVRIPIDKEVYAPILAALEAQGIRFTETEHPYTGYNPNYVAG